MCLLIEKMLKLLYIEPKRNNIQVTLANINYYSLVQLDTVEIVYFVKEFIFIISVRPITKREFGV